MASYSYDETGQYFFFLITFLTFILLPWTYFALRPKDAAASKAKAPVAGWNTKHETVRKSRSRAWGLSKSHVALALGWVAFAFVLQRALQYESPVTFYDPYKILGISTGASEREIKKFYKRLSLKFHPDKLRLADNQTKEEADNHFVELTKAYKALTDDQIRQNYEQYGHPDGKQEFSMGIALPKWMIETQNNGYVLGVYGLLFGIFLPWFVGSWWYGSRRITKDGALTVTADAYFKELKEDVDFERAVEIISASAEFSPKSPKGSVIKSLKNETAFANLQGKVLESMKNHQIDTTFIENALKSKKAYAGKAALLLYSHMLRVPVEDTALLRDQMAIVEKSITLCTSLMHISLAHNWLSAYLTVLNVQQHIIQAFHPKLSPLLQLPGVTVEQSEALAKKGVTSIPAIVKMPSTERKEILKDLSPKEYEHAVKIAENWPTLEIIDARFQVVGEKTVTPGSFVQLNLKVRITPPSYSPPPALQINGKADDLAMEEADEKDIDELIGRKKAGTMGETPDVPVHAPRFPTTRMPTWSVFVGDHKLGRVFVPPTRFNQFGYNKIRTMQLTFQAPPQAGLYTFQTYVKNSSYVGADAQKDMMMEVKAPQEEENGDDDDDISEPDEDTIAGQMAAMRGQPFKKIEDGDEEEEYTSSESEEEEESSSSDSDSD